MKIIFIAMLILLCSISSEAQEKRITKTGHLWFFSHTSIENIEAHSHQTVAVLVPSNGKLAIEVPILSFEFKNALMQDHFNENYMESAKYPKSRFLGTVVNIDDIDFTKDGTYNAKVEGTLTIHNISKSVNIEGSVVVKNGKVEVNSKFNIVPKDYNIVIENRFSSNIASSIEVNVEITL